ncbi:hypothetical protein R50073_10450 [Maricurvus nonylphenolicus]|uniref:alpha/beta fold hydrolase n=1 Tax=Maricurvus nonylphenolicus TaxID=1008307 RepID=UPI0036F1D824
MKLSKHTNLLQKLFYLFIVCSIAPPLYAKEHTFTITEQWFTQPTDHSSPQEQTFKQQLIVLTPDQASKDSDILFILGNETDATKESLIKLYHAYGSPKDVTFIQAEHRGYGQSITQGPQANPGYVSVESALQDYNRVIHHLKQTYTGRWMAAGYSYGGALAINFGHQFPNAVDAILASSAPIHWPFLIPQYDQQVMKNLGSALVSRLHRHASQLKPEKLYDQNWQDRELLTALTVALSQRSDSQHYKPYINGLSFLPTSLFINFLHALLPEEAYTWSENRIAQSLSYEKAQTGEYNWYTWKYQQCNELGSFFAQGAFNYTQQDHINDCIASFEKSPEYFNKEPWDVAGMLDKLSIPAIVVSGGRDPWIQIGVQPDHSYSHIDYFYSENGHHCPDRESHKLGEKVFKALRAAAHYNQGNR